ncbi:heme/hemin ABC transporter substrate-binding protein [Veronia pacifica]|uniref:Hemin receptor n=1 Tax=Veronia pacifica TaxID=1080227 RepID=A0A1C3EKH7_9GAMM|nr:ABC transporter substrate-binding protein [Veronia pacifica]ODA33743.1 hemin receptor [Veronia pacifica]
MKTKALQFIKGIALAGSLLTTSTAIAEPLRIISAGSGVTELIYALGAQDKLVAVDLTSRSYIEGDNIPQVGYHRQLSSEGLLALSPTHLIGSEAMGPNSTLDILKASGVTVSTLPEGHTLKEFNQRIDSLAALTNKQEKAELIKAEVSSRMKALTKEKPSNQPNVLFMMMAGERATHVAGDKTTINTVIDLAGGNNPAAASIDSYKALSYEAIVDMGPEYILISERTWREMNNAEAVLNAYPLLRATPAGMKGRILPVPTEAILGGFGIESLNLAYSMNEMFRKNADGLK